MYLDNCDQSQAADCFSVVQHVNSVIGNDTLLIGTGEILLDGRVNIHNNTRISV